MKGERMKSIICWGGDARLRILSDLLQLQGFECQWVPGENDPGKLMAEWVVLPVPTMDKNDCLTGSNGKISKQGLLTVLPPNCRVAAYLPRKVAEEWRRIRPDVDFLLMNEDESYLADNGRISAEGTILLASGKGKCLSSACCVVLGYGHMGRALCKMLKGLGANVTAVGRPGGSVEKAGKDGISVRYLDNWQDALTRADWVFNTIPQQMVGEKELTLLRSDCCLMELASAPYGIDAAAAREFGLKYYVEPSIPGRIYPRSAAEAMLACWQRMSTAKEGDNES